MLTPPDEHFTHQVAFPHAMVGSSDPGWRERYWLSLQDVESGTTVVTLGVGQYPNQDVQEAFVCCTHDGRQHNLRLSRRLRPASDTLRVGPFHAAVLEPYQRLHFHLDENIAGLRLDLDWLGSFEPFLEDRHFETSGGRVTHDLVRYVQLGRASGTLEVDGVQLVVEPSRWWGERDHSWGIRPLPGGAGAPPAARPEWSFLLFLPVQFDDFGFHLYLFEDRDGRPTHRSFGLMGQPPDGCDRTSRAAAVTHDLSWVDGAPTPTLDHGTVDIELDDGQRLQVELTARPGRAHLRGGGYGGVDGWFQGHWRGEDDAVADVWDLADAGALGWRGASSSDHLLDARCGDHAGHGIAEYMVLADHRRYGYVRGRR